ncbi:unnamed protein product [Boreogadus saida]
MAPTRPDDPGETHRPPSTPGGVPAPRLDHENSEDEIEWESQRRTRDYPHRPTLEIVTAADRPEPQESREEESEMGAAGERFELASEEDPS